MPSSWTLVSCQLIKHASSVVQKVYTRATLAAVLSCSMHESFPMLSCQRRLCKVFLVQGVSADALH
jgi:hypothetical protein